MCHIIKYYSLKKKKKKLSKTINRAVRKCRFLNYRFSTQIRNKPVIIVCNNTSEVLDCTDYGAH